MHKDNNTLDDIFGDNELPIEEVYRTAQKVVKAYMDKENKKIDYIARELSTTQKRFYKALDPNQPEHPLSVDRIIQLTRLTKDTRIVEKIAHEVGMIAIPCTKVEVTIQSIHNLVDISNIESSDVFREAKEDLADGNITNDEKSQILKEIKEAQTALFVLENSVENMKIKE